MRTRQVIAVVAAAFAVGCADRPLLDTAHPAVTGKVGAVSHHDIAQVLSLARHHLAQTGRASHAIYRADVWEPDMIDIAHAEPPKHDGDCLESFAYKRISGRWQLWGREIVCGHNIPTG
jgi:hypothetical protein